MTANQNACIFSFWYHLGFLEKQKDSGPDLSKHPKQTGTLYIVRFLHLCSKASFLCMQCIHHALLQHAVFSQTTNQLRRTARDQEKGAQSGNRVTQHGVRLLWQPPLRGLLAGVTGPSPLSVHGQPTCFHYRLGYHRLPQQRTGARGRCSLPQESRSRPHRGASLQSSAEAWSRAGGDGLPLHRGRFSRGRGTSAAPWQC